MRIDNLAQFIVPLTLFALWALTSLFNREAQPLPPRAGRAPGPGGPRPGAGQAAQSASQPVRLTSERRPTGQNYESGVRRREAERRPARDPKDDIVILETNLRRPATPQKTGTSNARKGGRGRQSAPLQPRRVETPTVRRLAGSMTSEASIASEVAQPRTLDALVLPASPLLSTNTSEPPRATSAEWVKDRTVLTAGDFRTLMESQHRLRECFIMNEILQPPVALRGRGYGRR